MNIGIIDADLLDNGTRHPNLALLKISGYLKRSGYNVTLLFDYEGIRPLGQLTFDNEEQYDLIYISKVFTSTKIPDGVISLPNVIYGGTGFLPEVCSDLIPEIEHTMPDYTLYDAFIKREIARGILPVTFCDYQEHSIGFATRGCFRKCEFCVNKKYDQVVFHAHIKEFLEPTKKYISLWDDNILGYAKWKEVFAELAATGKSFQFRQGLDIRLMTDEKADVIAHAKWEGDYIFAFDFLKDRKLIEKNLKIWRKHAPSKSTKLYILCAYESQDSNDIAGTFERISILMKYKCLPYIMRHESYKQSEFSRLYTNITRWCNQPRFFKKMSFQEFCDAHKDEKLSAYITNFKNRYPDIAKKYFKLRYEDVPACY